MAAGHRFRHCRAILVALVVGAFTETAPAKSCFSGRRTYWRCCVNFDCEGFDSSCCSDPDYIANFSLYYLRYTECWGGNPLPWLPLLYGKDGASFLQERCCTERTTFPSDTCFDARYTMSYCCGKPPRGAVEGALNKAVPWADKGSELHLDCDGDSGGMECRPFQRPQGLLLYCGPLLHRFAWDFLVMAHVLHYRVRARLSESQEPKALLAECYHFYESRLEDLKQLDLSVVVLVSPLLSEFSLFPTGHALQDAAEIIARRSEVSVIGFPTAHNGSWTWPVYQIRHSFWKLSFAKEALGYRWWLNDGREEDAHCYGGDTTSGTRVFRASVLQQLLESGPPAAELRSSWLPHLDLKLKHLELHALTCPTGWALVLQEESFLQHAVLEPAFSVEHAVEAAKFHPGAAVQHRCGPVTAAEAMAQNRAGLVVSYCYRKALLEALARISEVFQADRTPGVILPVWGSGLSVVRGSQLLPWEYDLDLILLRDNMEETGGALLSALQRFGFEINQKQEVQSPIWHGSEVHYEMLFRNSSFGSEGVVAELDIWLNPAYERNTFLGGTSPWWSLDEPSFNVHVGRDVLRWLTRYFKVSKRGGTAPWRSKLNGTGCSMAGHNACIPDVWLDKRGFWQAGIADNFVHPDEWA